MMKNMQDKPFHLLTPAEKTALRIAQNRAINEKIAGAKNQQPPAAPTADTLRMTPDERAQLGSGTIRKVQR